MTHEYLNGIVTVKTGDITREQTDAIVNAANSSLLGGSGVDGAIHRAGGAEILDECKEIRQRDYPNGLPTGKAVITGGGRLPAKYVIHTVGPIFGRNNGKDAELLAECYRNSLRLAVENNLKTIAFPSISTGVYSYPKDEAARVVAETLSRFVEQNDDLREIRLVFHSGADAAAFNEHQTFDRRVS